MPTSDTTVINYIVLYLNNIFHDFGHRELVVFVEFGDEYVYDLVQILGLTIVQSHHFRGIPS